MRNAIICALIASTAGQASAQGFLSKANDLLGRINGTMRGATIGKGSAAAPMAINQQTAEQQAGQVRALATPLQAQIAADRAEAKPLIEKLVMTSACATNDAAWNSLNRQSENPTTRSTGSFYSPIGETKYHSKNRCLDVLRVSGWAKPAKNALDFTVYLISAQSDEAKYQQFALVKGDDGEWLVRKIGYALGG